MNSAIIVKTWEHGFAKQCNISKLGMPSLEQKMTDLRKWSVKSCQLFYLLGKPSHERHKFGKGLILKFGNPKGFKTWKAKS